MRSPAHYRALKARNSGTWVRYVSCLLPAITRKAGLPIVTTRRAALAALALPALVSQAGAQALKPVSLTLPWLAEGSNIFAHVAKAKGYLSEVGLDVTISRGFGSVAAGRFDFGFAAPTAMLQQVAKGLPMVSLAMLGYDATIGVAVVANGPIRSPAGLAGKALAGTVTSGEYPAFSTFIAFFPVVIATATGLASAERKALLLARSVMPTRWQSFRYIRFPYAMPHIFAALKVALTMAMIGVIVGEFVTAQQGLGHIIMFAFSAAQTALMLAAIGLLCAEGLALYALLATGDALLRRRFGPPVTATEF